MELSLGEEQALVNELLQNLSGKGGALPGERKGNKYLEVVQKLAKVECSVMEVLQQMAEWSSDQTVQGVRRGRKWIQRTGRR